jgi:hypothetical protein
MFRNIKQGCKNAYRQTVDIIDNVTGEVVGKAAAVGTGLAVMSGNAMAAVPTEVTTALTDAKTDALAVAGLSLVIIIAIAAFKYMRRGV